MLQRDGHLLPEPGPDLAPAPRSAWTEQSLRELLVRFWQNPLFSVTAKMPLVSQAHWPEVGAMTIFLAHEFASASLIHSGTDEKKIYAEKS